jgi:cytochrome c-type biogenesis protein CcmE
MTRKQRRLTLIGTGLATIATALGLVVLRHARNHRVLPHAK